RLEGEVTWGVRRNRPSTPPHPPRGGRVLTVEQPSRAGSSLVVDAVVLASSARAPTQHQPPHCPAADEQRERSDPEHAGGRLERRLVQDEITVPSHEVELDLVVALACDRELA